MKIHLTHPDFEDLKKRVEALEKSSCPPHNLVDHYFVGAWGGSVPPPNKMCSKCLMTLYV